MSELIIDATNPANLSNKVMKEDETRTKLLKSARFMGCEPEMKKILDKYDSLLKNCTNDKERKDISALGIFEIYSLLGRGGELYVDGKLVYKEQDNG